MLGAQNEHAPADLSAGASLLESLSSSYGLTFTVAQPAAGIENWTFCPPIETV
jgi:hypothetical protein